MKIKILALFLLGAIVLTGCSIFHPVKPQEALKHPLGTDSLKVGMTKEQVKSLLGEPDSIAPLERSADILSTERQEWVYDARYSDLPVKADYLGKSMTLIFDGDNLVSYDSTK